MRFSETFTNVSVSSQKRKTVFLLKYVKAGDGNPLQVLESKIIYTLKLYIPFIKKKLHEKPVVSFDFENMNALYLGKHNANTFCSSSAFITSYTKKPSTRRAQKKTDQMNNRTEFRSLRKFACTACIAAAPGIRQKETTSSNM